MNPFAREDLDGGDDDARRRSAARELRRRDTWRIVVSVVIIAVSGAGALLSSPLVDRWSDPPNFGFVNAVLAGTAKLDDGRASLIGVVVPRSIIRRTGANEYTFALGACDDALPAYQGRATLPVRYRGSLPDLFREGATVFVNGYVADGRMEARFIAAKCAGIYERALPEETR